MINKVITVPTPVEPINVVTGEQLERVIESALFDAEGRMIQAAKIELDKPWPLFRAVAVYIGSLPSWKKFSKAARLAAFLARLDVLEPGQTIEIVGELWRDLCDALEDEDFNLDYPYNLQLPILFEAILEARDVATDLKEVAQT